MEDGSRQRSGGRVGSRRGAAQRAAEGAALAPPALTDEERAALAALEPERRPPPVPVRVAAVLGHARIPLARLRHLQLHQRMVLDRPRGPVLVVVNGRVLGTADTVVVQGQIGLRIRTWQGFQDGAEGEAPISPLRPDSHHRREEEP